MAWPLYRPVTDATTPVTDASPKAFWRFEDDLTDDATVGPYDLALTTGTETYADAGNGRTVFSFDGSTSLTATGYKGITGSNPRAISAWIKTTSSVSDITIITWGAEALGQRWMFRVLSTGVLRIDNAGGNAAGSTVVNDGKWHHVAAVLESGDTNVNLTKLYVDGAAETIASSTSRAVNTVGTEDVIVGDWVSGNAFTGQMDEVAIFDGLTSTEVLAIYRGGLTAEQNDYVYKESTDAWVTTDLPRGSGRYKSQLVTVSDQGRVYFGAV